MFEAIKKSAFTVRNNLGLTMSLVIYLIVISLISSKLTLIHSNGLFLAFVVAMLGFAATFFSGWFSMLKKAVENSRKTYETQEARIMDSLKVSQEFFPGVQKYILPVLVTFILYYLLFALWIVLNIWIANRFIGPIDFLFNDLKSISQSKEATLSYLANLPTQKVMLIYTWQLLFSAAIFIYSTLTMFWFSALYYSSKNPLVAFWKSFTAIFKKPLGVLGVSAFIAFFATIVVSLGGLFAANDVLAFIYMIITIFFGVYVSVLIFSYYEKTFADNCDNRPDSIGEDQNGNNTSEES